MDNSGGMTMNGKSLPSIFVVILALTVSCLHAQSGTKLSHNTPGFIQIAIDQGPVHPASIIAVNVWLNLHNQQQLDKLLEQQKQKCTANYQRWITQDQFNAHYAPTSQEVHAVSNFLSAKD